MGSKSDEYTLSFLVCNDKLKGAFRQSIGIRSILEPSNSNYIYT